MNALKFASFWFQIFIRSGLSNLKLPIAAVFFFLQTPLFWVTNQFVLSVLIFTQLNIISILAKHSVGLRRVQFENFQNITSDHKSRNARAGSYDFLLIMLSKKLLKRATCYRVVRYSSSFGFSFLSVAHVCQTFNQVCVAFNVFLFFAFSLSCSTMFWFDKANRLSAIFFTLIFKFGPSPVFP